MAKLERIVWEGWTVQDFIDELEPQIDMIMRGESWQKPFESKEDFKNEVLTLIDVHYEPSLLNPQVFHPSQSDKV